ncbi:MAG TPA: ATP-dependent zinc metalloprotease FtsH [Acidimicrobiales bacterium]|nr:ATP-dependent zinc metalloprotease FtsH [Acidimicrobiales bacterium]
MRSRLSSQRTSLLTLFLGAAAVLLAVVYVFAILSLRPATPGQEVPVSDVLQKSEAKAVTSVTFLQEDGRIKGIATQNPTAFWSSVPKELLPGLTDRLVNNGAIVKVDDQFGKATTRFLAQFVLPIVLLVVLFTLTLTLLRGGNQAVAEFAKFGGVGDRTQDTPEDGGVTFADVGGAAEAVVETKDIVRFLSSPEVYRSMGAEPPRGMLIIGPPGSGKTLLARALAHESNVPFLYLSGAEFVESLVGIGAARVRDLFAQARAMAPAIVFIDELDAVGRKRGAGMGMGHDEREQTLNQLLVEMDGFDKFSGVVVLAATNRPDILDPALIRPGRFDRRIHVPEPDLAGRQEILEIHARRRNLAPEVDLNHIAKETPGLSGAHLATIMNEAALLAVREGTTQITQAHVEEALERVLLGPARKSRLTPAETRRAAYHEAGHAVVARGVGVPLAVQKVSIVARGRSLGHHMALSHSTSTLSGYKSMTADLTVAMAGLAAEVLAFGDVSTASEGDIDDATNLARKVVCAYGMSDKIGRLRIGVAEEELFLGRDWMSQAQLSNGLLDDVDTEIRRLINEAEVAAGKILQDNRAILDGLAQQLVSAESMKGAELDAALKGVKRVANLAVSDEDIALR